MLNPDGVFIGNYRTGIIGEDFNRKFYSGKKEHFPEIECLKKIVAKCKKDGKILLLLDLHGHSILKNSFIYGPEQTSFHNHPRKIFFMQSEISHSLYGIIQFTFVFLLVSLNLKSK